jgi:hypothetical protein
MDMKLGVLEQDISIVNKRIGVINFNLSPKCNFVAHARKIVETL